MTDECQGSAVLVSLSVHQRLEENQKLAEAAVVVVVVVVIVVIVLAVVEVVRGLDDSDREDTLGTPT
ncbi:hypothetical protein E2C01_031241 [Portunus trituberculatus]|uniref:Uncharacterized protein n=1 Tax=Portunus trituberculatus TaxID=210409 RepID=A0A5B7ESY3_PORTR|nr:hypothetical protein [Portunus trituberculatus]